jgi:hypothetical protein
MLPAAPRGTQCGVLTLSPGVRERYAQNKSQAQSVWKRQEVQEKATRPMTSRESAPVVEDKAADAAGAAKEQMSSSDSTSAPVPHVGEHCPVRRHRTTSQAVSTPQRVAIDMRATNSRYPTPSSSSSPFSWSRNQTPSRNASPSRRST